MRRSIGRSFSQPAQFIGYTGEMGCERQFGAEYVQLLEIEIEDAARLQPQRAAHDISGHKRIAVAVAADPASHLQEGSEFDGFATLLLIQPILQRAMHPRHL